MLRLVLVLTYLLAGLLFSEIGVLSSQDLSAQSVAPPYYQVHYPASDQPGELVYGVRYTLWIPVGLSKIRGVIVHQHGCGEGACKGGQTAAYDLQWQALAKKHDCALLGPSFEQPDKADCMLWCDARNGSQKRFLQALADLSKESSHPELATVPWALWGHSGGGTWAGTMLTLYPERIAAAWLRSGAPRLTPREGVTLPPVTIPPAALSVPVMCNLGTQEGVTVKEGRFAGVWGNTETFFKTLRGQGALIGVSVDPQSSHDCGNQRYLAIPWFDACLQARLSPSSNSELRPMPRETSWLAPLLGAKAISIQEFDGNVSEAIWLPNQFVAQKWEEYSRDGAVTDSTPPPTPTDVKIVDNALTWKVEADFESGLAGFIIERNGIELARIPEKVGNSIGRPIFQKNSYHDTPSQPLSELKYVDMQTKPGEKATYRVIAINSVGLKSVASAPVDR